MSDFSVLIPVYWKEDPIRFSSALASVFANTKLPGETLLICDGPLTDELDAVIDFYKDRSDFRVVRFKKNQGIVKALNYGLKKVKFDVVVRCDSDDINHPNRFEKIVAKINEGFNVVGSQVLETDERGVAVVHKRLPTDHAQIVRFAKKRNPINHMSVCFLASDVLSVGGYPDVFLKEDYALWAMLMGAGRRFANLDESLVSANAGIAMYVRRGGLKAALSEFELQRILVKNGVSSPFGAFITGLARCLILCSPIKFRSFVYQNFLRNRKNRSRNS
jgi:glycosyltransferase involved in cell wall biosynthesis